MKSIKLFFSVITLILLASSAMAQKTTLSDEQKAKFKEHLKESFEKLDLSEEQKPKFKEISKTYILQIKTLKNSGQSKTAKERGFKSIIESKNKEMKALLSVKQYKIYEEIQKERLKKLKTFVKLDLSEEQKPKFREITKRYAVQIRALKSSNKRKFAKYQEFNSIIKSKNKEIKALLSPDQYKVYEEIQDERLETMKANR